MKTLSSKLLLQAIFLLLFVAGMSITGYAQKQTKAQREAQQEAKIKSLIDSGYYKFKAQSALPMTGRNIQLNYAYDVTIKPDTIVAYLPYYGRAYSAPMNMTGSGIEFASTKFTYDVQPGKKGGWDVTIKPQDAQGVEQLYLNITSSGWATLQVTSTSRDPISFNGSIDVIKTKKK